MLRNRIVAATGALLVAVVVVPVGAGAATTQVTVKDSAFKPDVVRVAVGGSVQWIWAEGNRETHNVREEGEIFSSGSPMSASDPFKRVFSAGTFYYYCEVHGFNSPKMDGFVKVPVTIAPAPAGVAFTVKWASGVTNTGSKFDVQYRIGSGKWKTWKKDVASPSAVFGAKGAPVTVAPGQRYSFRARSQSGRAVTRWSPAKSFQA